MLTDQDRETILRIVDALDRDDAKFVVDLAIRTQVLGRALKVAARDFRRLRRRARRPRHPVPRTCLN